MRALLSVINHTLVQERDMRHFKVVCEEANVSVTQCPARNVRHIVHVTITSVTSQSQRKIANVHAIAARPRG